MKKHQPPLAANDQEALRRLVALQGLDGTASKLGIPEMTLARAAAGSGLNRSTRVAISAALASLGAR